MGSLARKVEFELKGERTSQRLQSKGGDVEPDKLWDACFKVCGECPMLLPDCFSRFSYYNNPMFIDPETGIVISGGKISTENCRLRREGVVLL